MRDRYVIIMAGGIGSRFWPLSREEKPKQFLDILGTGETLIQQTFRRFGDICPEENILVVTNAEHKSLVKEQLGISEDRILCEPLRRNTAPCIAYGTYKILKENENAVIAVTPADHVIDNKAEFKRVINSGFDFTSEKEALLTIGIKPDRPDTGYGYIQADNDLNINGYKDLFKVKSFKEKPEIELAREFLKSGDFFWNAGIFIWRAKTIIKAFESYLPDINLAFAEGISRLGSEYENEFISDIYSSFNSISIDYGILEKAENVFIQSADIGWSDLGTWGSLYNHSKPDSSGNAVVRGNIFAHESEGNIFSLPSGKTVLVQGLIDFIVVDTPDALLIIKKEEEQKIKQYLGEINSLKT